MNRNIKKAWKYLCTNISIILTLLTFGCSNSMSDLLGDYNNKFTPIYPDEHVELTPVDDGFNSSALLLDKYVVSNKSTINLCAPSNCSSYTWAIQDAESGELKTLAVRTMDGTTERTQRLTMYIPDSGLQGAKTYRLSLDVISNNQKHFVDYATLAIYKDYYFETGIVTIPPGRSVVSSSEVKYADISTQSYNDEYSSTTARTILPPVANIDDSNIHYYLYAQNLLTGTTVAPFEIKLSKTGDHKGTGIFHLPKGNYMLTLMGLYETPAETSYAYLLPRCNLIGFAAADNRYDDSATFVLKSSVTESNVGYAQLTCYTEGWTFDQSDTYLAGFDITTKVEDTAGNEVTPVLWTDLSKSNLLSKTEYETSPAYNYRIGIKAGTYRVNIIFNRGTDKYTYSDLVTVSTGVTTEGTIAIPPVISKGITNLMIYTNGWHIGSAEYSGYTVSSTITNAINGTQADLQIGGSITKATLGNTIPISQSLIVHGEFGNYILNVKFKENNKEYIWSYPFSIEAGKEKTETEGIPSSVIPTGIIGGG